MIAGKVSEVFLEVVNAERKGTLSVEKAISRPTENIISNIHPFVLRI